MTTKVTIEEVATALLDMVQRSGLRLNPGQGPWAQVVEHTGLQLRTGMGVSFMFEEDVWAVDGRVSVKIVKGLGTVEVGSSTTTRSPASARAFVAFYSRVVDLACLLQAYFDGREVKAGKQ